MKGLADWLTVRHVNLLYPHVFSYSRAGLRTFERPPDLGIGAAWWPHDRLLADGTSRHCWLTTSSLAARDTPRLLTTPFGPGTCAGRFANFTPQKELTPGERPIRG